MSFDTEELELPAEPTARVAELAALSPARAAFGLAWPGIVEQLIRAGGQSIGFSFVGHLGAVATAAAGAGLQFTFLLFPIFNSLSIGTVALASRRLGEGRAQAAADVVRRSLVLGAFLGLLTGAAFAIFAERLIVLLGAAADVAESGAPFLAVIGGLNVFQTISIIGVSSMRAAGDTRTPMLMSLASALLVVPLSYTLMYPAGLGLMGNAFAFVSVNVAFCVATLALLWRGRAGLTIAGGSWRLRWDNVREIMSISVPSAAESLLFSVGLIVLAGLVLRLGTEAFAAHQIVIQLESLSFLPCIGFAAAASSLVGQSLGLRDSDRATRVGWAAVRMAAVWTTAIGLLLAALAPTFMRLFTADEGVVAAGVGATIVVGLAQPAQALIFTLGGALRGAGDTRYTLLITAFNWLVVRLPLALVLSLALGLGLVGIWLAIAIDYVVRAALMGRRFHSGKWQRLRY